jgi:hypothetical protein
LVGAAHVFDSSQKADYYIPSKRPFVGFGAVRQSIPEREDAYRDVQDYPDLPQRGVLLFLTWQELPAIAQSSNQLMTL